jgi:hypothetical protein
MGSNDIFQTALYFIVEETTSINQEIIAKKMLELSMIKKRYADLKARVEKGITPEMQANVEGKPVPCLKELRSEMEKAYAVSLYLFKSLWWGVFSKLNPTQFPELSAMMLDANGELRTSYDEFAGTVAAMDFHGYTQFSKDIKYNKTPLLEFGNVMPQKIEQICTVCRCLVYEMEGDMLIIIGPENPYYIFNAVLYIIEMCRQKSFDPKSDPRRTHGVDIKNPMIKPFELNAAVATGGRIVINKNGHIIGSLISEASRILKVINTKKPDKAGIMFSEKIMRKLEKAKETPVAGHVSVDNFTISEPIFVDVKGTRLFIREVYIETKNYIEDTTEYSSKLNEEIKKNTPTKWHNILSYYLNMILACLEDVKITVNIGNETYTSEKLKNILKVKFYEWTTTPTPAIINDIVKISSILFNASEEIRDVVAIYQEYVTENYSFIAKRLEEFYHISLKKEAAQFPNKQKVLQFYDQEMSAIKLKFPAKRLIENLFSNDKAQSQMMDAPYLGKK